MDFQNKMNGNGGIFTLNKEGEEVGRLTYTLFPAESKMVISYVLVHPKFEGRGMGRYLVDHSIDYARTNGLKIYPQCSYARSVMNRMEGVADVLLQNY